MAEDQAAGVPPAAETAILALGAGAAGPEPAAAPGMGVGQGGGGPPPAAAAAAAGQAAAAFTPQALIAASPGLGQGADVRETIKKIPSISITCGTSQPTANFAGIHVPFYKSAHCNKTAFGAPVTRVILPKLNTKSIMSPWQMPGMRKIDDVPSPYKPYMACVPHSVTLDNDFTTSLLGDYSLTGGASFSSPPFLSQSTEILPPWR